MQSALKVFSALMSLVWRHSCICFVKKAIVLGLTVGMTVVNWLIRQMPAMSLVGVDEMQPG